MPIWKHKMLVMAKGKILTACGVVVTFEEGGAPNEAEVTRIEGETTCKDCKRKLWLKGVFNKRTEENRKKTGFSKAKGG